MLIETIELHLTGNIHLAGSQKISKYEFAKKLLGIFGIETTNLILPKRSDFEFSKNMPMDSSLNTEKAFSTLTVKPESLEISLKKYYDSMIKS